jgi:hypothetical protein
MKMITTSLGLITATLFSLPALATCPQSYQIYDLGEVEPKDINNLNEIVGTDSSGDAVLLDFDPTTWGNQLLASSLTHLGTTSTPIEINDGGVVVGSSDHPGLAAMFPWQYYAPPQYPYRWETRPHVVSNLLGPPISQGQWAGHPSPGEVFDVNNNGTFLINSWIPAQNSSWESWIEYNGALFSLNGLTTGHGLPGKEAEAINDGEWLIGNYWNAPGTFKRAFAYSLLSGLFVDLHSCLTQSAGQSFYMTTARAINNRGTIIVEGHGVQWVLTGALTNQSPSGCYAQLMSPSSTSNPLDPSAVWEINDRDQAVGIGDYSQNNTSGAFLWEGGLTHDLNTCVSNPDWHLENTVSINDGGVIVGRGQKNLTTNNPTEGYFALVPLPEMVPAPPEWFGEDTDLAWDWWFEWD